MNLNDAQKQTVAGWLNQGLKLAEIQKRIETEFGLRPSYMEVKFLVGDLQVLPKDPPAPAAPAVPAGAAPNQPTSSAPSDPGPHPSALEPEPPAGPPTKLKVTVDQITRPGAVVSGQVTFSDGVGAGWYLDQMGRLGLAPKQQGYRPPPDDVPEFQRVLEAELAKLGF